MRKLMPAVLLLLVLTFSSTTAACGDDDNTSDLKATAKAAASKVASVAGAAEKTIGGLQSSSSATATGPGATIAASEKDFSITLDKSSAGSGNVTFDIKNEGKAQHEFVVIKTDVAPDKLPYDDDDAKVDEDKVNGVGEKEDIDPGDETTLSLDLEPGKYVIICNVPTHYQLGMHTALTVS